MAAGSVIERVDTILLSALIGPAEAGTYSVASRLALLVGFALSSVNSLLGPMSAELLARGDFIGLQRALARGSILAFGLAIFGAVALLLIGPLLLHLYGPEFSRANPALAILVVGQLTQAMAGSGAGMLAVAGKNRALIIVMSSAVAVNVVLSVILIPTFGQIGAALVTSGAVAGSNFFLALVAWKLLRVDTTVCAGFLLVLRGLRTFAVMERSVR